MKARVLAYKGVRYGEFTEEMHPLVNILRSRYDEFVRYCDKTFEDFIVQLSKKNKLQNTIVILSSDHGESFEHGFLEHKGPWLYEDVTNIPLIIKEPGQNYGKVINEIVEQIDIPATILDLAGMPVPSWMEGRSLVPLLRGEKIPSRPAFSMYLERNRSYGGYQITKGSISVWKDDYKMIHQLQNKKSLLYNLNQDPDELKNIFEEEPNVSESLLTLIYDNLKTANDRISEEE